MAAEGQPLFQTQRSKVLKMYADAKQDFNASTKPYKSTCRFTFTQSQITKDNNGNGFLVALPQQYELFSFAIGDPVPGYPQAARVANESDTNLSKARQTNGAEDFIIEGMSCTARNVAVTYSAGAAGAYSADVNVQNAASGLAPIYDPSSILLPPQVQSPFNLEDALAEALIPHIAVVFEWDREKIVKIGTLDQIPEGGRKSFLRAGGDPRTDDRYKIPEGYLWRRDGQPDSEFVARVTLVEPVVFPYTAIIPQGNGNATVNVVSVSVDLCMRLHGLSVKIPSQN